MMTTAYNPFLVLDMPYLKTLLTKGMYYIVLQRFNWPGLQPGRAFIATAYKEKLRNTPLIWNQMRGG
ncbi:hypothetical protein LZD49_32975 [Dyadobacter sp. CY261]|uniref:hypothetical protein n=1 Tax=Dyadobacter sp. CY261 TaxID=2907203 RepID=UPI001F2C8F94|nr:hypothetical protein [Dyadobacter sp. CY261]MCF0075338.1 hypothetical protein [Dyadobacter sp. CY261]